MCLSRLGEAAARRVRLARRDKAHMVIENVINPVDKQQQQIVNINHY